MKLNKISLIFIYFVIYVLFLYTILKFSLLLDLNIENGREILILEYVRESPTLFKQLFLFFLYVIIIHCIVFIIISSSTLLLTKHLELLPYQSIFYFLFTIITMWATVLFWNKAFYPHSAFSYIFPFPEQKLFRESLGLAATGTFFLMGLLPAVLKLTSIFKTYLVNKPSFLGAALLLALFLFIHDKQGSSLPSIRKPDILLIGLDSVSPLHLQHNPKNFPYLRSLLDSGTLFSQSITPLARTFPAWTSILTGKYPIHHGARYNLVPVEDINHQTFLSKILRRYGYLTIYAQDERKFNNLDESFGFDKIIGPSVGASEFVLTKISDLPLLNLFLLLPNSDIFFPQITYNRADYIHYSPERFVSHLLDELPSQRTKPLFMAVHLCLAHFPYKWRDSTTINDSTNMNTAHKFAIEKIEDQIRILLDGLTNKGYLKNAVIVILSDHGESLAYPDGLWLDPHKDATHDRANPSYDYIRNMRSIYAGHGTMVLDKTQYTTLLAFIGKGSQSKRLPKGTNHRLTSLVDVMPSVLHLVDIPTPKDLDGQDLFELSNPTSTPPDVVMTETGAIFGPLMSMKAFDEKSLLRIVKDFYTLSPGNARIVLKKDRLHELLHNKQYGVHTKEWLLAFLKIAHESTRKNIVLLVHKTSGRWTLGGDLELIRQAPLELLISKAQRLLGDEIKPFLTDLSIFSARSRSLSPRRNKHHHFSRLSQMAATAIAVGSPLSYSRFVPQ